MVLERTREERTARLYPNGIHVFDLPAAIIALREEAAYAQNGRNGMTLVKNPEIRMLVEVLLAGVGLAEHRAPGPITVQVLEGRLRFEAGEEVIYLNAGEVLSLPAGEPHAVEAVHDAAFLLTIAPVAR